MNKKGTRTYRSESLSLSPLKLVLTNARKGIPPRTPRRDTNEELAMSLIEKMKLQFTKRVVPLHFVGSHKVDQWNGGLMSNEKKEPLHPETNFLPPLNMFLAFFDKESRQKKKKTRQEDSDEKNVEKIIEKLSENDQEKK